MSLKTERISSDLLRELSNIMLLEAKDETLKHITLTDAEVTNDLGLARVYYTYMGSEDEKVVEDSLKTAEPYLRSMLASKLEIRHTPELRFIYDNSIEYGQNIERIINKLHDKDTK